MKVEKASTERPVAVIKTSSKTGADDVSQKAYKKRKGALGFALVLLSVTVGIVVAGCSKVENDKPTQPEAPLSQTIPWAGSAFGAPDYRLPKETFFEQKTDFRNERKVFAWYMVCCAPFIAGDVAPMEKRVEQYVAEIQMAQSMGIEGFGLDIMRSNKPYHESIEALFQAAKKLDSGFKLFFEFDYGNVTQETEDITALIKKYSTHECYQTVRGRPLVCAYAADSCVMENNKPSPVKSIDWWRENVIKPLQTSNLEIFFVPTTWQQNWNGGGTLESSKIEVANWGDTAQGLSKWEIQTSPIGGGLSVLERQATALHDARKTWMSTVVMHYWCGSNRSVPGWYWTPGKAAAADCVNGTYYEHAGSKGLDIQWKSVINVQHPEWVMMLTWNDYNESYIAPIDDYRKYSNGCGQAPLGWYKPMAGLDELNRYYIQWYKTGVEPKITADSIFYSYRTSSHKLIASADPRPPVKIGNGPIGDDIYLTTALTAPARLQVISGDSKHEFDLPAGINQAVVPFDVGKQVFSLWRNGKQIVAVEGEPVVGAIQFYNYRPTTGYVTAKPSVAVGK